MRTWLVVIGSVLAALGVGLIVILFALSGGPATSLQASFEDPGLAGHLNQTWMISGPPSGSGSVTLTWSASSPANVTLWPVTTCKGPFGPCSTGPVALSWVLTSFGKETFSSTNTSLYLLVVTNPGGGPMKFSASVSVSYSSGATLTAWNWWVIALGGVALLTIGGIALFLGLFLPGGAYRDPDHEMVAVRHPSLPPEEYDTNPHERSP